MMRGARLSTPDTRLRWASWAILGSLLAATLLGAWATERRDWPAMLGDESTYAMQAASLAWDGDLRYTRADYDRFVRQWRRPPENLILQSRDGGETIVYSKPFLYALAIAPFVRLDPRGGAALANALFMGVAAVLGALALERRLGPAAPLWVALFLYGSVAFVYVLWLHADLFLLASTALALSLVYRLEGPSPEEPPQIWDAPEERPPLAVVIRWLAVGLLLGIPAAFRPFYLALLVPVAFAIPRRQRRWGLGALFGGAFLLLAGATALHHLAGGSWLGYGPERQGFYSYTGYPEVDFPAREFSDSVRRWGNTSWIHAETLDVELDGRLLLWDGLYFLAGRHVGVLPYFFPVVLALLLLSPGRGRSLFLPAILVVVVCFFLVRPFNFWGGAGAVGNRYFLPLYPLFWFLTVRRVKVSWLMATAALSGLAMWPLWIEPLGYPLHREGGYRHVSPLVARWLPYETTQSHLKPAGREDVIHRGLWLKFLDRHVWSNDQGQSLRLMPGRMGNLLVGSDRRLASVSVELGERAPTELTVAGGEVEQTLLQPTGGVEFRLSLPSPRARHRMWWSSEPYYLYELRFGFPELEKGGPPLVLSLTPEFAGEGEGGG